MRIKIQFDNHRFIETEGGEDEVERAMGLYMCTIDCGADNNLRSMRLAMGRLTATEVEAAQ